jgi:protein-S-isoprenylcysteine O-methyltransferase Ste14
MTGPLAGRTFTAMSLRIVVYIVWGVFWAYWLMSAIGVKQRAGSRRLGPRIPIVVLAIVLVNLVPAHSLAVHSAALKAVGVVLLAAGLGLAVWARIYLGRNWGTPMTQKVEPELVTSGPYRFVRHPIYSGILLGFAGTALAINGYWALIFGVCLIYFIYSARVEEGIMTSAFPTTYPSYRARTKMLIPFLL